MHFVVVWARAQGYEACVLVFEPSRRQRFGVVPHSWNSRCGIGGPRVAPLGACLAAGVATTFQIKK